MSLGDQNSYSTSAWSNAGTINASNSTVNLGGPITLASLGAFTRSGGTVNLTGTLDNTAKTLAFTPATGSWNLVGGTITGGTISSTGGAVLVLTGNGGTLAGVTIAAGTAVDATQFYDANATITGGLTLNGTLNLGKADTSTFGQLYFSGTQTLGTSGTGTILFGGNPNNALYAHGDGGGNPATLTIASGITIHGNKGTIGGYYGSDSIVNDGTINADVAGGTISINGGNPGTFINNGTLHATGSTLAISGIWSNSPGKSITATAGATLSLGDQNSYSTSAWSNAGTINASNSTVNLGGPITLASLGAFTRSGGTVNLTGTLDNTAKTLAFTPATGSWNLVGGTITGGTISSTGGAVLVLTGNGGTLAGVTIAAGTAVDATQFYDANATITGGLTLNGTLNLGKADTSTFGQLYFSGTQTLGTSGTGTILFGGNPNNALYAHGDGGGNPATLTIASGITIHGNKGTIGGYYGSDSIVNDGTINADVAGGTISINGGNPGTFINNGTLHATGSTLAISGIWSNSPGKSITATAGATLSLGDQNSYSTSAWSNAGTINASNSTVNLGGPITLASLGAFTRSGGTVNLTGTLDNTAKTLAFTPATGSWNLVGGTITGGTISSTGGAVLVLTGNGGTLAGVTIAAGTAVDATQFYDANATITGGLTLNGTLNLGKADTSTFGQLYFSGTQTLGTSGTGTILFGGNPNNALYAHGDGGGNPATLTIASGITIHGNKGTIGGYYGSDSIVNDGTINADVAGGTITVSGTFTNKGTLKKSNGGMLIINGVPF